MVGLIAKTSGSVRKGFAVMVGLLFTCPVAAQAQKSALLRGFGKN